MRTPIPLLCVALMAAGSAVQAAAPAPPADRTVTLAPDALTVRQAVQSIATQTGRRILLGPGVSGTIGINLNAAPLEAALTAVTKGTGNTWSRLTVPADQAQALTPEKADALSRAADALVLDAIAVRTADGREVTVSPALPRGTGAASTATAAAQTSSAREAAPTETPKSEVVYVVRSIQPAPDARAEQEKRDAEARGTNMNLAEDAKRDPAVVDAYSTLKNLSPDQMAMVTREFIMHVTPDERKVLEEAFRKQREQFRPPPPQ